MHVKRKGESTHKSCVGSNLKANVGTAKFDELKKVRRLRGQPSRLLHEFCPRLQELVWTIGKIPKDTTPCLNGSLSVRAQGGAPASGPPPAPTVFAKFRVPMFSVSGLKVDGLSVTNTAAKPYKGVRTVTKAGRFQVRTTPT